MAGEIGFMAFDAAFDHRKAHGLGHLETRAGEQTLLDRAQASDPTRWRRDGPDQADPSLRDLCLAAADGDSSAVAILDGGLPVWMDEGRPLSTEPATRPATRLTPALRLELIADRDEVLAAIGDDTVRLIDTLPEGHYRGEQVLYGRAGHIPGADNVSVLDLTDESSRYRPIDELAALFDGDRETRTITYCGGGIAASSAAFVMTRLGFTDVAVYTASLQEWAADPANPMVVDTP